MTQPGFDQQATQIQYAQPAGTTYFQHSPEYMQGAQYKEKATTYAIVGLFVLGFIFGPLAILNANRAKALNQTATVGKVLGWCVTIQSFLILAGLIVMAIVGAIAGAARNY